MGNLHQNVGPILILDQMTKHLCEHLYEECLHHSFLLFRVHSIWHVDYILLSSLLYRYIYMRSLLVNCLLAFFCHVVFMNNFLGKLLHPCLPKFESFLAKGVHDATSASVGSGGDGVTSTILLVLKYFMRSLIIYFNK